MNKPNLDEFNHLSGVNLIMAAFEATKLRSEIIAMSKSFNRGWRIIDTATGIKVTGVVPSSISVGDLVEFSGKYVSHPTYGDQFQAKTMICLEPKGQRGIKKYLDKFSNIGPSTAEALTVKFGDKLFDVIENEPHLLEQIKGITGERAAKINYEYKEIKEDRNIDIYFATHGITWNMVMKLEGRYGSKKKAYYIVKQNPYKLASDVWGVGFIRADGIAKSIGIATDSPARLKAGVIHTLKETCSKEGHCYLKRNNLLNAATKLLGVRRELVYETTKELYNDKRIVWDGGFYPNDLHMSEIYVAKKLKEICWANNGTEQLKVIRAGDHEDLDADQLKALQAAVHGNMVSIITGGPGVGKTYVINSILQYWLSLKIDVALAAPTGKAAKRMEEATKYPAQTIHRLLSFNFKSGDFKFNEEDPLTCGVLIIDETSMIDIGLMKNLLAACPPGIRIVFVGDVDQLPSVGPGSVLMDMIISEKIHTTYLRTLHRQAERSLINVNAKLINDGKYFKLSHDGDKDFWFIEEDEPLEIQAKIVTACKDLPAKQGFKPDDIQVLAPMKKSDIGVKVLNEALRPILNPLSVNQKKIPGTNFFIGDRVIQLKNNYKLEIFNGDMGKIVNYEPTHKELLIEFNGISGPYDLPYPAYLVDELAPAYALTVHKSQGSEFPVVVIPLHTQNYIMLKRNLLYTAITRGKKMVVLIGSKKAAHIAIKTLDSHRRNTRLAERINEKDTKETI